MEKLPLQLNWKNLLSIKSDEPPAELEVLPGSSPKENYESLQDNQLAESIQRHQCHLRLSHKLPDKGEKLRANLKRLTDELERRKLSRLQKDAEGSEKPVLSGSSYCSDASPAIQLKSGTPESEPRSSLTPKCSRQMQDKSDGSLSSAFDQDLNYFGRTNRKSCRRMEKGKPMPTVSSRDLPFRSPSSLSDMKDKSGRPNADQSGISYSKISYPCNGRSSPGHSSKKRDAQTKSSPASKVRKVQTVVLLDEDEAQPTHPVEIEKAEKWMKDAKIYYPSRSDPEAVELCFSDMECLDPESFVSSPVMNYYIQYLQKSKSPSDRPGGDYHFFNTYFYKKLEEAVSHKRRDKDTLYEKIRRWWKGVNIFEKAYIFLPVHADHHWSLVIISFPAKEEETGPVILHLDSLGYHPSSVIFENIESFLKEEWKYLNQVCDHTNVTFSERVWKNLSRRIERKIIPVPQQKNDYDCGLFVLYFMERFIEEAPERLRRKDLAMFGSRWFLPEEASGLRKRIRKLLQEQFERSKLESDRKESSDSPVDSEVQSCDS
ncbi:ubiquitin-like-specific protease 1D [Aristolochia californica]|uniref:ubiquitin-like-specific protease 1D n=1 Tax=Aristolochia californica TaxID=171875 RepID=UPI0035DB475C